jgi:pyridoxal phosphate enzyme (YggS family)
MSAIAERIERVRERIQDAAIAAGRDAGEICLIAVSKTVGVEAVREAWEAGVRDFGENYVQDARTKIGCIDPDVRWHFIGHLQTNKARYVAGTFALVHSVDSERLAMELNHRAGLAGVVQDVLIEVRLDLEGAKTGVLPSDLSELVDRVGELPSLRLCGLMGMAPIVADPEQARPHFARLRGLLDTLPVESRKVLSMGMTADFEAAIREGATHVRIGTAIFGPRA